MQKNKGLRTIEGVYIPTLLTILGVILYLRLGWVVGNAGIIGALMIIGIAHIITIATTLSMSSMLTNIKVGSGGAYSIISQSLGLEVGGAIGIPLFISQAISVAFYITGFTELWSTFFPHHYAIVVSIITWIILAGLSIFSTKLAFRVQYVIIAAVVASLISFIIGDSNYEVSINILGKFEDVGFWQTFAIFFPAVTGILTGATMSGELEDPRKSIIKGTLLSVVTGLVVYSFVAYLFAIKVPKEILMNNNLIILEISASKIAVVAGIMGAVLSSALSTLVSAPRTLAALAENRTVPFYVFLSEKSKKGEPKNAIIVSSIISLSVLVLGNLDGLASLLTLFFLTTYAMINLVVLIEKILGIVSFRPSFSVTIFVPVIGFVGCLFSMILINSFFTVLTVVIMAFIYFNLKKKNIHSASGDVRGGIFIALAEWAAQKIMYMPYHPKFWKPSIIVPVEAPDDFKRITGFIRNFIFPSGRLYYLTVTPESETERLKNSRESVLQPLKDEKLFAQEIVVQGSEFNQGLSIVLQSISSTFLSPNCILFTISDDKEKQQRFNDILMGLKHVNMGIMCLHIDPKYHFGQSKNIYLWLRDKSPNQNLAVLTAIQLCKNWNANLTICRIVKQESKIKKEEMVLRKFIEDVRLPVNTKVKVEHGNFEEILQESQTDLHIMGMPTYNGEILAENMIKIMGMTSASIVFISDSGLESALA